MNVYEIDPTTDARWDDLLQNHPQASIFHTPGWLEALKKTYDYTPVAFTTSPPGSPLTNAIPFCKINGFFGKPRLVSLPFSDHCEPLVTDKEQLDCLLAYLQQRRGAERWNYIELRPKTPVLAVGDEFRQSHTFLFHELDLRRDLDEIIQSTHKDCIQRKIRRAEREELICEQGTSDSLLSQFYQLLIGTRRRHGLPAQPIEWFRNLVDHLGERLTIRVVSQTGRAVASILTLRFKHELVYKYGCSDHRLHNLGGIQLLLWRAIRDAKNDKLWTLDMGRTDPGNPGLVAFKNRWGTTRTESSYLRHPITARDSLLTHGQSFISTHFFARLPTNLTRAAGSLLYRYMA